MLVLGLSGMFSTPDDHSFPTMEREYFHDAAACLIEDGRVVAAVEEERLNRVKHTNLFPALSATYCLQQARAKLTDVDRIGYFWDERWLDVRLSRDSADSRNPWHSTRELLMWRLRETFGADVPADILDFWPHHRSHAAAVFHHSGFPESLILVADGRGEDEAVSLFRGTGEGLHLLRSHPASASLGLLYAGATRLLGYGEFDEYKVMGLAPYGDARQYRPLLESITSLLPDGGYELQAARLRERLLDSGYAQRGKGQPLGQEHKNLAAAVQDCLERIVLHILRHWARRTGSANLCLAGGVAQNSAMNGRILASNLFRQVFVDPASHDAGAAVGSAVLSGRGFSPSGSGEGVTRPRTIRHVYLGPALGPDDEQEHALERWGGYVAWRRCRNVVEAAARSLADGNVIGWAQGRSEFGPRALGNRSILADPRDPGNKDRVNRIVKNREGYRPFAPAVLEEHLHRYFAVPQATSWPDFMGYVMTVRAEAQRELPAVTHVDGTARLQVVRRTTNERFWRLLAEFHRITGTPVLLNTSFNNNAEPIVQTTEDCIVSFITTGLDVLYVGDYEVTRRTVDPRQILRERITLPTLVELTAGATDSRIDGRRLSYRICYRDASSRARPVSGDVYSVVVGCSDAEPTPRVPDRCPEDDDRIAAELWELWRERLIVVSPQAIGVST